MKESAHKNIRESEYLFFPIGNIIQEIFVRKKHQNITTLFVFMK